MSRFFNGKKIELLAPAGTMETFKSMVQANCDAIYFGGKILNMRMIRKGFNFSNEEIHEAAAMAHAVNKKVYVTVNNLLNDYEIGEAAEYLQFLQNIQVDGIIIQDLGILQICKEQNLNKFEIHSSVMMNVHNIEFVKVLKGFGVSRVVLSREMDLKTAKNLQNETGIETEYFVHGDMCTVNGANCYYSSFIWGNSSNRGRCFKPCRWPYRVKKDGVVFPTEYPLAAKDMYMYEHIPELIEASVTSFKIEGRMRDTDFIVDLVNTYGEAIDRYIGDPLGFDRKKYAGELFENRKRDFTTAYAFTKPGLDFINTRYEGTGKFYSTGKVFSTPTEEPELTDPVINRIQAELSKHSGQSVSKHNLSVKVNNYIQAKLCIGLGVDRIYLPCEVLRPDQFITLEQLQHLASIKNTTELYLDLPQMMDELQFDKLDHYLGKHGYLFDGLLVSNLGAVKRYGHQHRIVTNYNVNIYNHKAMEFYQDLGVSECTVSIETKVDELVKFIALSKNPLELIVHGPLRVMYLDHNLYENAKAFKPIEQGDNQYVDNSILVLMTDRGENPVYIDQNMKNHLFTAKEFCLLPILNHLNFDKPVGFRIEGQTYTPDELKNIIEVYQKAIADPSRCKNLFLGMKSSRAGFTAGSLSYKFNIE
ncbi:U32 family peptidase [Geosporobacter ferrireducens]|uniref:Peptidase U32 n=1 Tax=Geosporobacter ferrireducens TaxID=1424294 RepID=A0A1D8GFE1_9FIRM|nr:U32 family peptidase [Geosporobacter ferrireducens]AOT69628.1 peptidase U32 [Geosporobacter ferrireducens]MTI54669.1 U32 family peptidase [Geosporobacter ferrireducens]